MIATLVTALSLTASTPLQPTERWVVDFADARCVASREYGKEAIALKASPLGDVVQFIWATPGGRMDPRQIAASLEPSVGTVITTSALAYGSEGKSARRFNSITLSKADFDRVVLAQALRVRVGKDERVFALGGMANLAKVMKTCVDDLQRIWVPESGEGQAARSNLASYIQDEDFPSQAVSENRSGTTTFALLVDETGKIADCTVTGSSGHAVLDVQSCALISRRARFQPGRDAQGKPRKERVVSRINWMLPQP